MPVTDTHLTPRAKAVLRKVMRRLLRRPSVDIEAIQAAVIRQSGMFDAKWYLEHYPDVAGTGVDPALHYVRYGAAEGRNPSSNFETTFYLSQNPDVVAAGMNPFWHYVEFGHKERRMTRGETRQGIGAAVSSKRASPTASDAQVIADSGVFDPDYYLREYPAVARAGVDPVVHYVNHGAMEGRNPCALFDTRYYLAHNPDVVAANLNPLVHFCRYGCHELRNPSRDFDIAWYWLTQLAESDTAANPLAHYLAHGATASPDARAVGKLSKEDKDHARAIANRLLERDGHDAVKATRLGVALSHWGVWPDAEKALSMAVGLRWDDARAHARLAGVFSRRGKWWQAVESWTAATGLDATRADWFFRLGEAQEEMNRFELAAEAYRKAVELKPGDPQWMYLLGHVCEKAGRQEAAKMAYAEAVACDSREDVKAFGIGVFHEAREYWPEAAEAYSRELEHQPASAKLHYRLGMAFDRAYEWHQAEHAYCNAIALEPQTPSWHYRYGFVLERQHRYAEAAEAYAAGATLNPKLIPYWWYRCGYVLAQAGRYEDACRAYLATCDQQAFSGSKFELVDGVPHVESKPSWLGTYLSNFPSEELLSDALARDRTNADTHYRLGEARERCEDWHGAARAYTDAVDRSNAHQSNWYYRLGFVLAQSDRFEEACYAFRQTRILQTAHGVSETPLVKASAATKLAVHYAEYFETLLVRDNVIMYESHLGKFASCNPLAIFRYLSVHADYRSHLHVWTIDEAQAVPDEMRHMDNVVIVKRQSDLFVRYMATAKYFINNSILPQYFVRRPEQKYLATWHGTPLKTLGKQQQYKFQEHKRAQRNFLQATHIISPNSHTTGVLFDSYDLRQIMGGKLAETGYPRIDLTLNASEQRRSEIRAAVGVTGNRPVVLYAPTWRGTLETVSYEVDRAKSDISRLADHHDCDVVFRGHHLIEQFFKVDDSMGCIVAPAAIDTNELLSIVDVLITDYSSIFFDFLPTGKPILYYIYDQEEYERERGLYFAMEEMPGFKCRDFDSLNKALTQALQGQVPDRPHYVQSQRKFNSRDDGNATQRVVDFFFRDDDSFVVDPGPRAPISLLMQGGGLKRNGITTSFLNLLKIIDRSVAHVTVALSPDVIEFDPEARESFDRIPKDVAVVARHGLMPITWEEYWLRGRYESVGHKLNDEQMSVIRRLFDREFRRVFGTAHFDVAVSFSGYDGLWTSILNLCSLAFRKVIYLHNDMVDEYVERFPKLMQIFRLYDYCDKLACVCDESNHVNRGKLSELLGIPGHKFTTSENAQDPERIVELSGEAVQAQDEYLFAEGPVFVNMARLSVEKDHAKLIRAFSRIRDSHPSARLLILGIGPLEAALRELVKQTGLTDCVHLLGLRSNPYAYLRRSHCFVLSSNHEARCMSLMEALIVGLPCVATDISGNHDIKKDFPQYFFENSEDGLHEGMQKYLAGNLPPSTFDWKKYQDEALRQFESRVLNITKPSEPSGLPLRNNPVLRSNRVIVAARVDGLGERMNAILNGMYLAERLGFDFAYFWNEKGSWEKVGADSAHHAIEPENQMFSANFIARYSLEKLDRKGLREVSGKGVGADDLIEATLSNDFKGWLAPRVDLGEILDSKLAPGESWSLKKVFSRIEFSPKITKAIEAANAVKLPAGCVAIHLRSGDIFYGPYRKLVLYTYKGMTLPIAKAIVRELRNNGESAILFGQDKEVMQYIKRETGALLLEDVQKEAFDSPAAQAIFELVLMSRCNYIVAGSSGFAKQASWVGGIAVKQPKDLFDHVEQTRISIDDLAKHADEYHPLQTAFAYWYAYYHGRQFKSADLVDELLERAAAYDPDNQLYPMKRAFNFYRQGRLQDGEVILKKLITDEYIEYESDKLPVFHLLTAKTLSKFNMAEDFESISFAAKTGGAFAAACNYLIARARKLDEANAFETFSASLDDDPVLNFLHATWSP